MGLNDLARITFLLSAVLLVEGVVFQVVGVEEIFPLAEAPRFVALYVHAMSWLLPVVGPLGIAASVGLWMRREWGRRLLAGLLYGWVLIAVLFGAGMFFYSLGAPESEFRRGKLPTLVMGPVITVMIAMALHRAARVVLEVEG